MRWHEEGCRMLHLCISEQVKLHAARYGYYFSASLGYKNTAVKKLTTTSQMIQFLAFMTQVLMHAGPL
jgi:GNS1/SUR4 family